MRKILTLFIMLMFSGILAFAQNRVVTGTVTDDKGVPIEGASVRIKGSRTGIATDAGGNFSISVPPGATLVFSGAGITPQEVAVGTQSTVNVSLTTTETELAAVTIVTAQGIRRQPRQLGYSTARLSNTDVNQAHVTNIATGLAAKVSGLQINLVNNSVNPSTRITLRGNRSILGNNQALLVLDDVPVDMAYINSINPNDIESVTVLKGASASALYGSEASNGVIIITTKKGTKGRTTIQYSNTTELQEVAFTPKFQNEYGQNGGEGPGNGVFYFPNDPFTPYVSYENQSFGPHFNGQTVVIGAPVRFYNADGTFFDSSQHTTYSAKPKAKIGFFDKGLTIQNNFSVSGADEKSSFYFSMQDVDISGVVPKDKNHRDAIRLNGHRDIGKFSVIYSADYTFTKTDVMQDPFTFPGSSTQGGGNYGTPGQQRPLYFSVIQTSPNIDLRDYKNWQTDPFANPSGYFNAYYANPWWQIDQSRTVSRQNDLLGSIGLNFKPLSWVNLLARASISRQDYTTKYTRAQLQFNDFSISNVWNIGGYNPQSVKLLDPQAMDGISYSNRLTGDFIASANKTFGSITTTLILGGTVRDSRSRQQYESAASLIIPDFYNISNVSGTPFTYENFLNSRFYGVYGDLTLGYNNYLFLHGSLRNDWTSLLSKANRSYLYPAVDLSFVFTDAIPALKGSKVLSFGKIRGAYSRTAEVSIGAYALQNVFNAAPNFPYGSVGGFTLGNNFANPDIKPEFTTEKEIGLDLGFLNNRINFSGAYYHTLTNNQTIPVTISSATGGTSATINSGEMTNDGIEADLKFTPVVNLRNGLRWDFGINFTYINNKVKSITSTLNDINIFNESYAIVGQPYPILKVTDWNRDPSGRIIVDPVSGFPSANNAGPLPVGPTNPPYKIGLTSSISWKGFTLSGVADFRTGAVIDNQLGSDLTFSGVSAFSALSGRQRFVIPNSVYLDASGKYVPNTNITTSGAPIDYWASTLSNAGAPGSTYVTSADFWKIRELALSYEFPRKLISGLKWVQAINIGVVGRNLFTWTAKENLWTDPEFSNTTGNGTGVTNILQTPPTRIFGANLTVTF